jgi:YVTN family beta-propeller protein
MSRSFRCERFTWVALVAVLFGMLAAAAQEDSQSYSTVVSTGQRITPLAAPGSTILPLSTNLRSDDNANAANAVTTALSPDGSTLLVSTSGYNNSFYKEDGTPILWDLLDPTTGLPTGQTTSNAEWVFVYDVSSGTPVQKQKFNLPVTYNGLVWNASGTRFYASGGANDIVYPFVKVNGSFQLDPPFVVLNTGGQLDNTKAGPMMQSFGLAPSATVAGLALSKDGSSLYTANFENDSVSIVDTKSRQVSSRVVFAAPGGKKAVGEYPFWVVVRPGTNGKPDKVFVSSQRDGQVVVFDEPPAFRVIKVGSEPNKMALRAMDRACTSRMATATPSRSLTRKKSRW